MFYGVCSQFVKSVQRVLGAGVSRRLLPFGVGRVVVLAALCVVTHYAAASDCGSYVIANPTLHGKQMALGIHMGISTMSHGIVAQDGSVPHVPTPCERGFCRGPESIPFVPPAVPIVTPVEHLLPQRTISISPSRESLGNYCACSAHPCSGFRLPLERPPESLHV